MLHRPIELLRRLDRIVRLVQDAVRTAQQCPCPFLSLVVESVRPPAAAPASYRPWGRRGVGSVLHLEYREPEVPRGSADAQSRVFLCIEETGLASAKK